MASIRTYLLGDSSSLDRAFKRANRSAAGFNRGMTSTTRSSARSQGAMRGLGRTVVGLGAGYLGAAGLIAAVRGSWQEMGQAARVTAQTNAVIKSTGGVANVTAKDVDSLGNSILRKSGIDDEATKAGANMLLTFKNIRNETGKGNDIFNQSAAALVDMDVAMTGGNSTAESLRKTGIRLGKALNDPVKGVTALARVGVQFTAAQKSQIKTMVASGNVLGAQKLILRELNTEFGGSAAAFGGTLPGRISILRETVRNLGATMLTQLMPAITRTVNQLTAWVSKTQNQKTLLNGFRSVVGGLSVALNVIKTLFGALSTVVGGNKNAVKALVLAFVAFKAVNIVSSIVTTAAKLSVLARAFKAVRTAYITMQVALAIGGFQGLMTSMAAAIARARALRLALLAIRFIGPIGVAITVASNIGKVRKALGFEENPLREDFHRKFGIETKAMKAAAVARAKAATVAAIKASADAARNNKIPSAFDAIEGNRPQVAAAARASADAAKKAATTVKKTLGKSAAELAAQRNNWFDALIGRKLDRVQDIGGETGQIAALAKIAAQIKARMGATKDITRKLALEDQLLDVVRQQRSLRAQKIETDKSRREEAAALKKEKAEAALAAKIAGQFRSLGLTGTGEARTPGKANLKKQLGSITQNVKGTILDTNKTKGMLARIRKVLAEGIVPTDVRSKIQEMLAGVRDELKNGAKKNQTLFRHTNSDAILSGLGLSPEQMKLAKSRLSQIGAGGTVPGARTAAFAGAGSPTVVHTSVNLDGQTVARNTTRHQQKAGARRSPSRRGPSAGLGFA